MLRMITGYTPLGRRRHDPMRLTRAGCTSATLDDVGPAKSATVLKVASNRRAKGADVRAAPDFRLTRAFMADIPIGVVTISDRASRGVYEDKGGPGIEAALADLLASPWRPERRLVPTNGRRSRRR